MIIRPVSAGAPSESEWTGIRELCCLTGNSGAPIDRARWPFFSEFWVGAYQRLRPEWTYVAVEDDKATSGGKILGYLNGCPDTRTFEREKACRFIPALLLKVALGKYAWNADTQRFYRRSFRFDRGPEQYFSPATRRLLRDRYGAHLHVNVDEEHRSLGLGARLMDRFLADLRDQKISGVHLYCGPKPLEFYRRHGFQEIERIEFRPGTWVYAMALELRPSTG